MPDAQDVRELLSKQRYREAAEAIDRLLLSSPQNDELWYLRGIASLKQRNYDAAQECFERALMLGKKSRYFQIKGMAHFEMFEMDRAVEAFSEALRLEPDDATTNFFLGLCYMFLDDPRADLHIRKAHETDRKKTRQLLLNFYTIFLKDDPRLGAEQKRGIEAKLRS